MIDFKKVIRELNKQEVTYEGGYEFKLLVYINCDEEFVNIIVLTNDISSIEIYNECYYDAKTEEDVLKAVVNELKNIARDFNLMADYAKLISQIKDNIK